MNGSAARIRVLIADAEPHVRGALRELLRQEPDVEVVGESGDGQDALGLIAVRRPELLFLDMRLPGLTASELVASLGHAPVPRIVVTSAQPEDAAWAFDIEAVDYLLKPFERVRFRRALQRVRQALGQESRAVSVTAAALATPSGAVERRRDMLKMKVGSRIKFIAMGKVRYIRADGDYIRVTTADEEFQVRECLKDVSGQLDADSFLRVHRSVLLNVNYIREMRPWLHGDFEFTMQDGRVFHSSASYRKQVRAALGPAA